MSKATSPKLNAISRELSVRFSFVRFNVPLKDYSTLKVGGPAWAFAEPATTQQLIDVYEFARTKAIPIWVLGAGSSVIPNDRGFRGLIICTRRVDPSPKRLSSEIIEVSCGVFMPRLVIFCKRLGLKGLEWSIGIPGTIGGGIWMNAGASGSDIYEIVENISLYNGSEIRVVHRDDVRWRPRYSSFQDHPDWLILSARLRLQQSTPELVDQAIHERLKIVKATQPRSHPNVGTVFKANRKALPALAAGLQVGSMICCEENPGWINNLGEGTSSDAYHLVRRVMWRHLWRGLPMPKIEPIFLPYDPCSEVSPTTKFNHPPFFIRLVARISHRWGFLFKGYMTSWRPRME